MIKMTVSLESDRVLCSQQPVIHFKTAQTMFILDASEPVFNVIWVVFLFYFYLELARFSLFHIMQHVHESI